MVSVILVTFLMSVSSANLTYYVYAQNNIENATPYGEKCTLCGEYGYCSKIPSYNEAINALQSYYGQKGMNVIVLRQRGRFMEVEVYRNKIMVDRIILDLRTGRLRSAY